MLWPNPLEDFRCMGHRWVKRFAWLPTVLGRYGSPERYTVWLESYWQDQVKYGNVWRDTIDRTHKKDPVVLA